MLAGLRLEFNLPVAGEIVKKNVHIRPLRGGPKFVPRNTIALSETERTSEPQNRRTAERLGLERPKRHRNNGKIRFVNLERGIISPSK